MLVLASASPRRHELLLAAGIPHLIRPANIEEIRESSETPESFVQRLAREKALAVSVDSDEIVLGADTIVTFDGIVLGKPNDAEDSRYMLRQLSGRTHFVHTAIFLRARGRTEQAIATTQVHFAPLTSSEIEEYIRNGEGSDKAGAYAIQGLASKFIDCIQGSYHNVVGLPVSLVYRALLRLQSGP